MIQIARCSAFAMLFFIASVILFACSIESLTGTIVLADSDDKAQTSLNGSSLSGEVAVVFEPNGTLKFSDVQYRLNGTNPAEPPWVRVPGEPFTVRIDTTRLFDGQHRLTVVGFGPKGQKLPGEVHATFKVENRDTEFEGRMPRAEGYLLAGEPEFSGYLLSREMRVWYERLWSAIRNNEDLEAEAQSGSLRAYGYPFQQHMMYLFTALRVTGDLRFADEIARLGDMMADQLTTEWYDPESNSWYAPTDGTEGYRRWVYLRPDYEHDRVGQDTGTISSYKAHAVVAIMAHMFDVNRDLPSPTGVDYGAKADFWLDYLISDFEAIWRIRSGTSHPEDFFRYSENVGMSTLHSVLTYHYYMHKVTGDPERLDYARVEANAIASAMYTVDTPLGAALIFGRPRNHDNGLTPIAYARYTWALQTDLALDGHTLFADPEYMAMHARTLAHFVLDNGTTDLSFDIGGMQSRKGTNWLDGSTVVTMPTQNPYTDSSLTWGRESFNRYKRSYMTPLAAFGQTEKITQLSTDIFAAKASDVDDPEDLAIPTGMLLVEGFSW